MQHRVCILGNAGSGKSSLANELGHLLNIPVFHLDREMLYGNFEKHSPEKRNEIHSNLVSKDEWIIEGNYHKHLPQRVERATLIIFLDVPRLTALSRAFQRARIKNYPKDSIPEGASQTTLSWVFIRWMLKYSRRARLKALKDLIKLHPNTRLLILDDDTVSNWSKRVLISLTT